MKHIVVKSFTWCPDGSGIVSEDLVPGDERDFGDIADSLVAEGYIEAVATEPAKTGRKAKASEG